MPIAPSTPYGLTIVAGALSFYRLSNSAYEQSRLALVSSTGKGSVKTQPATVLQACLRAVGWEDNGSAFQGADEHQLTENGKGKKRECRPNAAKLFRRFNLQAARC